MLPPPPPRNSSTPFLDSRSMPLSQNPPKSMLQPPPSSKSMHKPLPKFDSPVSVSKVNDRDTISNKLNPPIVPDTLVKLMEYGDDDDDDDVEEGEKESCKNSANQVASLKPFWAV